MKRAIDVYVRGTSESRKVALDVKSLEKSISDNVRMSFELEGHKISDADWKRITKASNQLSMMI